MVSTPEAPRPPAGQIGTCYDLPRRYVYNSVEGCRRRGSPAIVQYRGNGKCDIVSIGSEIG